jgi:hypothetical protein
MANFEIISPHHVEMEVKALVSGAERRAKHFILTGIAVGNVYGNAGGGWHNEKVRFDVVIPGAPGGGPGIPAGYYVRFWAPCVTLASIGRDAPADVTGWAVDGFRILNGRQYATSLQIECDVAARSGVVGVWRLAYNISILAFRDATGIG